MGAGNSGAGWVEQGGWSGVGVVGLGGVDGGVEWDGGMVGEEWGGVGSA